MADKPKKIAFTSPKLVFKFPKLNEPDYGSKDYPKPEGEFSVKGVGRLDDPEVKAFIAKLQPFFDAAVKDAEAEFKGLKVETRKKLGKITVNPLYTELYDKETEEPTGEVEFKFSMGASGEIKNGPKKGQKWSRKPTIYDAKGAVMKKAPPIWGGTVGKIAFTLGNNKEGKPGYFIPGTGAAGLSLKLDAVQIIDLVSQGERSASSYGFGAEEGYTHDESAEGGFEDETSGGAEGGAAGNDSAEPSDF